MSEQLTFYTNPQSRGTIVRWMLEETGAEYQTKAIKFGPAMKSEEYLAINPIGKVPAIVHGSQIVTEVAAICAYLADAFPQNQLAPPPAERAAYYRWLFFAAGPVEAAVTNKSAGFHVTSPQLAGRFGYGTFETTMDVLAHAVSQNEFVTGNTFTAADVYVGSQINFGLLFSTMDDRPEFRAYWNRLQDRPAYQRAVELDAALQQTLVTPG